MIKILKCGKRKQREIMGICVAMFCERVLKKHHPADSCTSAGKYFVHPLILIYCESSFESPSSIRLNFFRRVLKVARLRRVVPWYHNDFRIQLDVLQEALTNFRSKSRP